MEALGATPRVALCSTLPTLMENLQWLERKGLVEKVSAPFKLTKRSLERVEEPAYFFNV